MILFLVSVQTILRVSVPIQTIHSSTDHFQQSQEICSVYRPEIVLTQKRSKIFFQYSMRYFNDGNIYPTRARPFHYYQLCNWIDTEMENMKSEILYEKVQHL